MTPSEEFIATIICPACGSEHVSAPSEIPEFCQCGQRFWSPAEPTRVADNGKTWMVVRRSTTMPGGYRVVQHGLTEAQAIARATQYKRPHEAMSWSSLVEIRRRWGGHDSAATRSKEV